ncbi:MAG: hypothetical protein EZS28_025912 [Streblomastix strix]|uniref:B30.2/SPRY domain-containing protein n=1 Tax=Streblomastix strix TaxID=222440 RepID=A0A5J4V849_9EUKA|nr:MAG: hypothetical protein EZS28_025912 [Streblomastix strix]
MTVSHTAILPSPDDVQVVGETFTLNTDNSSVILFDPIINKGIVRFEVLVVSQLNEVGIAVESARFGFENVARFMHKGWFKHIGGWLSDYTEYKTNDRVTLELNMDSNPRTLSFFVNDKEQKLYVVNVPAAVRFWAYLQGKPESFKVLKFETVSAPTAKHSFFSSKRKWGEEWK